MAEFYGYWISPKGRIIEVYNHLQAVAEKPKLFGIKLTEADIMTMEREEILIEVIKKGWTRVRGHKQYFTFEFWEYNIDILIGVMKFVKKTKMWDNEIIHLNELKSKKYVELTVGELKDPEAMEKYHLNPKKQRKRRWEKTSHEDILWGLNRKR